MAGVGSWNHSRKFEITNVTSNTKKRERKTEVGWGWVFKAHLQCHTSSYTSWTCQGLSVQMPSMGDISHSDNYKYMPIYTQTRDRMSCLFFFVCMYTLIIFKRTAFLINLGFINAFIGPTPVPALLLILNKYLLKGQTVKPSLPGEWLWELPFLKSDGNNTQGGDSQPCTNFCKIKIPMLSIWV